MPAASCLVEPATRRAVYCLLPSHRVAASTDGPLASGLSGGLSLYRCDLHALEGMMSPFARASCRCLSPGERSSVMSEPSSLTIVAEYFSIHFPW
jgi:hypothetical protein